MDKFINTIRYIANKSAELMNLYTQETAAQIEFACIFCQSEEEYMQFTNSIETLGKIVESTQSGFTYLLDEPIRTKVGPLLLVKIRKPDPNRPERGDADFNTDYKNFKKEYQGKFGFKLIKRAAFEMLRLSSSDFDVMACFSNIPKSKSLSIKL